MTSYNPNGQAVFEKICGGNAESIRAMLKTLSPELDKFAIDFPFGEFYAKEDKLNLKTRELITIASLATQATLPQLKFHLKAALNVGNSETEIEEAILQLIPYIGIPKVLNALTVFKEVKAENA